MMLMTKRDKIQNYIEAIGEDRWSAFEQLLSEYLSGKLTDKLKKAGLDKPDIYIDFLDDYKCINIQGKCKQNYIDIQVEETEFSIGCDPVEPDEHEYHPLESEDRFFEIITQTLNAL